MKINDIQINIKRDKMSKKTVEGVYYGLSPEGYRKYNRAQVSYKQATDFSLPSSQCKVDKRQQQQKNSQCSQNKEIKKEGREINEIFKKEQINSIYGDENEKGDIIEGKKRELSRSSHQQVHPKKGILKRSLIEQNKSNPAFQKSTESLYKSFNSSVELNVEAKAEKNRGRELRLMANEKQEEIISNYDEYEGEDLDNLKTDRSVRQRKYSARGSLSATNSKHLKGNIRKQQKIRQQVSIDEETVYKRNSRKDFQDRTLKDLNAIVERIYQIEEQMQKSEQRIIKYRMQKQFFSQQKKAIEKIQNQNKQLKMNQTHQISYFQEKFPLIMTLLLGMLTVILLSSPKKTCSVQQY